MFVSTISCLNLSLLKEVTEQGSVFFPTLFLIVMDQLLQQLKEKKYSLSVCHADLYAGEAFYTDDLSTATYIQEYHDQANKQE